MITAGDGGGGVAALGGVYCRAGRGDGRQRELGRAGYRRADGMELRCRGAGRRWLRRLGFGGEVGGRVRADVPCCGGEEETGNPSDDANRRKAQAFLPENVLVAIVEASCGRR